MPKVSSRGDLSLSTNRTSSFGKSRRRSEHPRRLSYPVEAAMSREDSSVKTRSSNEDYDPGTMGSSKDSGHDRSRTDPALRTDSAIGIQRELQLAFINIAKDLWPMIRGVMESDTPSWLKECCQDNYFSKYTYRRAKIMIGEEITFEDVNISSADGSKDTGPNNKLGLLSSFNRSDKSYYSQAPDSPCGSIGSSSNVSRGSDTARSTKSLMSLRSQKERPMP